MRNAAGGKTVCRRCGAPASQNFSENGMSFFNMTHGLAEANSCERCVVERQVLHAREKAAQLPSLEAKLIKLGGPAAPHRKAAQTRRNLDAEYREFLSMNPDWANYPRKRGSHFPDRPATMDESLHENP